jgi:hypothetical protein
VTQVIEYVEYKFYSQEEINKIFERACFRKFFNFDPQPANIDPEIGEDLDYMGNWEFHGEEKVDGILHYVFKCRSPRSYRRYPKRLLDGSDL